MRDFDFEVNRRGRWYDAGEWNSETVAVLSAVAFVFVLLLSVRW